MRLAFYLVDVFTERPLAGNQLAVVLDSDALSTPQMQAIAREFNFSETTFVGRADSPDCDWRVRIFTPVEELPMAGHPVIGTAVVLRTLNRVGDQAMFELGIGPTSVAVRPGWAQMAQRAPVFGRIHPDTDALASALSIGSSEIKDSGLPAMAVGTGLPYLIVALATLDGVRALKPRLDLWDDVMSGFDGMGVYAFARAGELPDSHAHCRMFAPNLGILEDPATGSAAGPLACYLAHHTGGEERLLGYRFEQGFEMGRPSLLDAEVERADERFIAVRVGGSARIVGEGWLTGL